MALRRPASIELISFNCPHCDALAHQSWYSAHLRSLEKDQHPSLPNPDTISFIEGDPQLDAAAKANIVQYITKIMNGEVFLEHLTESRYVRDDLKNVWVSECYSCGKLSVWIHGNLFYPPLRYGEEPNQDLPDDVRADYEEARSVINLSPRSAAALLRLCIQKLCAAVGERGKNINDDIKNLVTKGLDIKIQQALDIVRVIGNESVHPGQIDLKDDRETAVRLFGLVNLIAEKMISEPKHIKEMFDALPESKRKEIDRRDGKE